MKRYLVSDAAGNELGTAIAASEAAAVVEVLGRLGYAAKAHGFFAVDGAGAEAGPYWRVRELETIVVNGKSVRALLSP